MRLVAAVLTLCISSAAMAAAPPAGSATAPLTLTKIMANPDWISVPPEMPYWGANGKTVYYSLRPHGAPVPTLHAVSLATGRSSRVSDKMAAATGSPEFVYDRARTREAYVFDGNVYVKNLASGKLKQLTRGARARNPQFMADGKAVAWLANGHYVVRNLDTGLAYRPAAVKTTAPPSEIAPGPYRFYTAEQSRLFKVIRKRKHDARAQREYAQKIAKASGAVGSIPFYIGKDVKVVRRSLSPSGRWMLLVTEPAHYDAGPHGKMPNYITMSGRNKMVTVRRRVGWNNPAPEQVMLLDLVHHKQYRLDLTQLPGIKDDPLAKLRKSAVKWDVAHGISREKAQASVKAPKLRPVQVWNLAWNPAGTRVAIEFRSVDNKDRWITTVDFASNMKLVTRNRLTDSAWINWNFNGVGWLPGGNGLWYLSEKSDYSELYLTNLKSGDTRQLTDGKFEVYDPVPGPNGKYIYYRANKAKPGVYGLYRLAVSSGKSEQLTHLGGVNGVQPSMETDTRYMLSPHGKNILFYHSGMLTPPELYLVSTAPGAKAKRLTHTIKPGFENYDWIVPKIVHVPSTHFKGTIQARLYLPHNYDPGKSYAGVAFIHGAGYLQDAHRGWSYYFHEMMFNNFLAQHGYVVIDMDYRGSQGYGRDWRTTIYQHMGHPEVQDITDGMHWLEKNYHVDPNRLGVYGGSYGGFMTYMMMFRRPDLFKAGAAIRPVADWANYNDLYTSDILNRPAIDPEAYETSSAINYAQNLKGQLLIEQGVEDNNVFFQDTVHMTQKLIELENPHFSVAFFPIEHHGFVTPSSWLDEYRRVWKLFCTYVSPRQNCHTDR
ncbi:MAG: prolyl oligopeptidase family serine peptidase [Gammaproteobacteria bacterium]